MALKDAILTNLLQPVIRRVGTAIAAVLVAKGFESPLVEQFINGLIACLLVGIDLVLARFYRRAVVTNALSAVGLWPDPAAPFDLPKGGAQ